MKYQCLINKLIEQKIIKAEDAEIYVYGLNHVLLYISSIAISAFFAFLFHGIPIYLFFLFVFVPLRRFMGGFHFHNPVICMITSQIAVFLPQIMVPQIMEYEHTMIVLFILSYIAIIGITLTKKTSSNKNRYTDEQLHQKYTRKALAYEVFYGFVFSLCMIFHQPVFMATLLYAIMLECTVNLLPDL